MNLRSVAKSFGRLLGLVLLLLGVVGVVFIYPAWRKAAQKRDAANAQLQLKLQENRRKAEQGDAESQFRVGVAYFYGQGVQADEVEALRWLRNAASQKNEHALDMLNHRTSFQEFKAKAEQGDAEGQYKVGDCYFHGKGVKSDEEEAMKWYRQAAEQNHAKAQWALGNYYHTKSMMRVFLLRGHANALGSWEADKEAVKWLRKAAEQNEFAAFYSLGVHYERGLGVEKDNKEAWKWFRRHFEDMAATTKAEQGDAAAQNQMGVNLMLGQGVKKDEAEAVKWYLLAAAQGHAAAQDNLARCYFHGEGVKRDYAEAYAWETVTTNNPAAKGKPGLIQWMSSDQIEAGKRRAEELRAQIAERLKAKSDSKP